MHASIHTTCYCINASINLKCFIPVQQEYMVNDELRERESRERGVAMKQDFWPPSAWGVCLVIVDWTLSDQETHPFILKCLHNTYVRSVCSFLYCNVRRWICPQFILNVCTHVQFYIMLQAWWSRQVWENTLLAGTLHDDAYITRPSSVSLTYILQCYSSVWSGTYSEYQVLVPCTEFPPVVHRIEEVLSSLLWCTTGTVFDATSTLHETPSSSLPVIVVYRICHRLFCWRNAQSMVMSLI